MQLATCDALRRYFRPRLGVSWLEPFVLVPLEGPKMAWKAGKSTTLNMASVDFWGVNGIFPSKYVTPPKMKKLAIG